jgi:excisionase family DNA binding protein
MHTRISTGEAARRLGISQSYVLQLIYLSKITADRTPLVYLIDEAEIERFKRERDATEEPSNKGA